MADTAEIRLSVDDALMDEAAVKVRGQNCANVLDRAEHFASDI
ncbi:MAG: hypothetical protein WBW73_01330 [Rhodoplanes sp.]